MDKKYLISLTVADIPEKKGDKKILTSELIQTKKEQVLAVNIFNPNGVCRFRIFITPIGFHTLDMKKGWCKRSLGSINSSTPECIGYHYVSEGDFIISENDTKLIADYFKSIDKKYYEKHGAGMVQRFIDDVNSEKSNDARSRKQDFQKSVFEKVPPLPSDIDQWVRNGILKGSKYIFMQPKKEASKSKEGYCTHCEQIVRVSSRLKHNDTGCCPNCKSEVVLKSAGVKRGKLKDNANFYVFQAAGKDVFIRFFVAERDYRHDEYSQFSTEFKEYARYYVTGGEKPQMHMWTQQFRSPYCWSWYGRNGEKEACGFVKQKVIYSEIINHPAMKSRCALYNKDIEKVLNSTCLQDMRYNSVKKLITTHKNDIIYYANAWIQFPFVEYLIKSGLSKLADAVINERAHITKRALNCKAKKLNDILKVTPQDLTIIRKYNYNWQAVQLLQTVRRNKYHLDLNDLNYCIKFLDGDKTNPMLNYVTLTELVNYVKKQMIVNPKAYTAPGTVLSDWTDYIKQLITLEYDLNNSSLIRPKNLNEKHQEMSRLLSDIEDSSVNEGFKKRLPKLQKRFEYSNDEFMVVVPTCAYEIKNEGAKQDHCVGGYVTGHSEGSTTILFLRRVAEPYTPFYTIEFEKNHVNQCRGYNNKDTIERQIIDNFLSEWLKNKVNKKTSPKNNKKAIAVA